MNSRQRFASHQSAALVLLVVLATGFVSATSEAVEATVATVRAVRPIPTPLSRSQFLAAGSVVRQRSLSPSQQGNVPAYLGYLCRRTPIQPLITSGSGLNQIVAFERVYDQAVVDCGLRQDDLNFERGFTLAAMVSTRQTLDRLSGISNTNAAKFCTELEGSSSITKPLLVEALDRVGLIEKGDHRIAGLAIGLIITNCSSILDQF